MLPLGPITRAGIEPALALIGTERAKLWPTPARGFAKVPVGRHFADVPPNRGMYRSAAKETIDVAVHSEQLKSVPPELAAERVQSLAIPTYPGGSLPHQDLINQQQAQQQQA